ncbi:MAG TPA: sigma-70 family RNA polymerase sigma factor [Pirellulales bacterium]|jgi:RNA polymerase sigma factor (sigma-70 family)|nr:sigma-70 family RNA polymerase sigma factor [Pirellulales bacterium]
MGTESSEFRLLLLQASDGSERAVEILLQQYGSHVLTAVRRRLDRGMRRRFDSTDFVQAVWASFFGDLKELKKFESPRDLIAHLAIVARNKVITAVRRETLTKKRETGREERVDELPYDIKTPTPSQVAIAHEQWEALISKLPLQHQRILFLRISGHTHGQIAEELGISSRTVRRLLKMIEAP